MKKCIFIKSNKLGTGNDELGSLLMKSFINTINNNINEIDTIIFMNSGVLLASEESNLINILQNIESKNVTILSCGTCLDFYKRKESLKVGKISNMNDIFDILSNSSKIITI